MHISLPLWLCTSSVPLRMAFPKCAIFPEFGLPCREGIWLCCFYFISCLFLFGGVVALSFKVTPSNFYCRRIPISPLVRESCWLDIKEKRAVNSHCWALSKCQTPTSKVSSIINIMDQRDSCLLNSEVHLYQSILNYSNIIDQRDDC